MSARAWSLFASVSVVWGIPYLLIKIAVDGGFPPVTLAWPLIAIGERHIASSLAAIVVATVPLLVALRDPKRKADHDRRPLPARGLEQLVLTAENVAHGAVGEDLAD